MSLLYDEGQQAIATESARVIEARSDTARQLALLEKSGDFLRLTRQGVLLSNEVFAEFVL